jgi:hypothetical protein
MLPVSPFNGKAVHSQEKQEKAGGDVCIAVAQPFLQTHREPAEKTQAGQIPESLGGGLEVVSNCHVVA